LQEAWGREDRRKEKIKVLLVTNDFLPSENRREKRKKARRLSLLDYERAKKRKDDL